MTPDEYWNADPFLAKAYVKVHKLRIEQTNQQLWMQGLYIHKAVEAVVANMFSKRTHKYLEKPIDLFKTQEDVDEEKVIKEREKAVKMFESMRKQWEKKHGTNST